MTISSQLAPRHQLPTKLGVKRGTKKPSLHKVRHSFVLHRPITYEKKINKNHRPGGFHFQARLRTVSQKKKKRGVRVGPISQIQNKNCIAKQSIIFRDYHGTNKIVNNITDSLKHTYAMSMWSVAASWK